MHAQAPPCEPQLEASPRVLQGQPPAPPPAPCSEPRQRNCCHQRCSRKDSHWKPLTEHDLGRGLSASQAECRGFESLRPLHSRSPLAKAPGPIPGPLEADPSREALAALHGPSCLSKPTLPDRWPRGMIRVMVRLRALRGGASFPGSHSGTRPTVVRRVPRCEDGGGGGSRTPVPESARARRLRA